MSEFYQTEEAAHLEKNIRVHLDWFAGYTDRSVHGVDMDVMRAFRALGEQREREHKLIRELLAEVTDPEGSPSSLEPCWIHDLEAMVKEGER